MKASKDKMTRLADHLRDLLGPGWKISWVSKKDCEESGRFDPPCAHLHLVILGAEITICDDGETYVLDEVHDLDFSQAPLSIAYQVIALLQEDTPT